jgi:hypothetical protein
MDSASRAVWISHSAATNAPLSVVTVIASGLHNPRGLNFGPDGALYVVEAAANSPSPGPCAPRADGTTVCAALSGSITRLDLAAGTTERIIESLPSLISPNGDATAAFGVHDISFQASAIHDVTVGLGGNPALRTENFGIGGSEYARLARFNPSGKFKFEEDRGDYEVQTDPDGHAVPDSNPYGLLALPGKVIYADAGGNALNQVTAKGEISTLADSDNENF